MSGSTQPQFSVIIPTFNRAHVILRTLGSLLAQTCQDFELIVVDDGSTDNTRQIFDALKERRIRYSYQPNRGVSAARNLGAAQSRGSNLVFLDSDDEVHPHWLESFRVLLADDDVGVACVGMRETRTGRIVLPTDDGLFRAGTFALRRRLFLDVGGYVESLRQGENTELGIRLTSACRAAGLAIRSCRLPLLTYRNLPDDDPQRYRERYQHRLATALYMLEQYGDMSATRPHMRRQYLSIAGVNAARVGKYRDSRRFLRMAIRECPADWRNYGRMAVAYLPPLSKWLWVRD